MRHIERAALKRIEIAAVNVPALKKKFLTELKKVMDIDGDDIQALFEMDRPEGILDRVLDANNVPDSEPRPKELEKLIRAPALLKRAFKEAFKVSDTDYAKKAWEKQQPNVKTKDGKILKFIGDALDGNIKSTNVGQLTYIKWKASIEINGPRDLVNVYTQFREGEGDKDDSTYLGRLGLTLDQFENWLISKGARKVKKPKPAQNYSLYD